ncbi:MULTISPECIES: PAS domain-containing protein [Cyanophyceae]|uniref:PAS domain-containing protein n=1 Tax=Cyanophyceae TaxID=3028117 RepID=UPI00016DC74A|nr:MULTISPECIES: PAS domain-containing protein [Cyanophyceae]ACA98162.1 two-component hybrid sensor and regulator; PAS domain S-box protein [Picosynechococcus sp. PCC 7002]SMH43935.1 PAS domain S-box-containing protein [Picosynechococcus sp. OG1]SMQ79648.1 PAS domain S-box-containing protein [Synechococcus sp. 7002]
MSAARPLRFLTPEIIASLLHQPVIVSPDLSLIALSDRLCADLQLVGVLVMADEQLLGTVSPGDILRAIAQGENPQTATAAEIMQRPAPTYPVAALDQIESLCQYFAEQQLAWLTLVDEQGRPVGILPGDRLAELRQHLDPEPAAAPEYSHHELKFFEEILENAFAGYWDWDCINNIEYLSPSFKRMFGYADHELPNRPESWQKLIFPEDLQKVNHNLQQHIASHGEIPFCNEVRYRHRDGSTVWVLCSGKVIEWDAQGQPLRIIGSHIDLTPYKRFEERLKRSEASLQEAQRLAHIGSWEVDLATGRLSWSPELLRMFGLNMAQGPPTYDEHWALIHPDDQERLKRCVETAMRTGESYMVQYRAQLTNGQIFYHEARGSSQKDASGKTIRFFGTALDITERVLAEQALRESELRWQFALEGSGDGVWDWNAQTNRVFFSRQWKAMLGYSEAEIGDTLMEWESRVHPDDLAMTYQAIQAHLDGQTEIYRSEHRVRCKDGSYKWILDRGKVIEWTPSGEPLRIIGTHSDIGDRKQAELALIDAKEAAEAAAHAKSMFLATMSHEIRTPMNGIIGMLNLLLYSEGLTTEQQEHAHIALSSAESLLMLLNDILDFSKMEAGKLQLETVDFDLHQFFENFAKLMAFAAQEKGLNLIFDLRGLRHGSIQGDPGRLRQILTNLVSNAIKFTNQGEVMIRCQTERVGDRLDFTCSVTDTGIGIAAEKLNDLFEPFTQLEAGTTRRYGGTGLGLAITQRLCQVMGGTIEVISTPGEGSCFTFTLGYGAGRSQLSRMTADSLQGLEILIVEEQQTQREILRDELQAWGATVQAAANGQEAIALWQTQPPTTETPLLILDHSLREIDALTLAQNLQQLYPQKTCQLLLLTTFPYSPTDPQSFPQLTATHHLVKPILSRPLWQACRRFCENFAQPNARTPDSGSQPSASKQGQKISARLLLVEDNPVNQIIIRGLCQQFGFSVDVAPGGTEALQMLQATPENQPYRLILMDCLMPKMNGFQTSQHIRRGGGGDRHRQIPIIALTTTLGEANQEQYLAAGMNDYLSKPLNPQTLRETLNHWLQEQSPMG